MCCYNSSDRVVETLSFLGLQKVDGVKWEVIVVNNCSADNTRNVVNDFIVSNEELPIKLVEESRPGLVHARTKGIEAASYDVLVYCDDDNHLEENYLQEAFILMCENPEVFIAGGLIKPKLPFYPGKWIEANYGALAIGARAEKSGYVDWVFGAGMVVRKDLYAELQSKGISLLLTGRSGSKQTSGDDAELCHLARFLGHTIYYSQKLILHHKVAGYRLSRWHFIASNYKNVFMVVYFYLLDKYMKEKERKVGPLLLEFFGTRVTNFFYFLPRIFLGKNRFYSFMMLFQNAQLLFWLALRRRKFMETASMIRGNLYDGR